MDAKSVAISISVSDIIFTLSNVEIKQFGPGQPLGRNVVDFISALFQKVTAT